MKLKIYINSSSTFTTVQMLNFAECAGDFNVIKIVSWYRTPLNEQILKKIKAVNTLYLPQISHLTREYIAQVLLIVDKYKPENIEVHANINFCHVESYRLICSLIKNYSCEKIKLHLYDDGAAGVMERTQLNMLSEEEFHQESTQNSTLLLHNLMTDNNPFLVEKSLRWPALRYYCWHHIVATTYHILSDEYSRQNESLSPFMAAITPYCEIFDFSTIHPKMLAVCLCLLNVDYTLFIELKNRLLTPDAIVYVGTGCFDRDTDNHSTDKQINKIHSLKKNGIIGSKNTIIFKPHPINHPDNIRKISEHLGDNVFIMPAVIPFELFIMAGVIPGVIVGFFSTLMLFVPKDNVKYIFFDAKNRREALENIMMKNLVRNKVFSENDVYGWSD